MKKSLLFLALCLGMSAFTLEAQHTHEKLNLEFKKPSALNTYDLIGLPARMQSLSPTSENEHTGTTLQHRDGDEWNDIYRHVFEYDEGHFVYWKSQYFYDGDWINDDKSEMIYENGLFVEHIWSEWDNYHMEWIPEYRATFEYIEIDGKMRYNRVFTFMPDNDQWITDTRITFSYEGNAFSGLLDEKWFQNQWIPYMRGAIAFVDGSLEYTEEMWYSEGGWTNDMKTNFSFIDEPDMFLSILPIIKGEMYQDGDGNLMPSNMSMYQWFDQALKPENMEMLTFTEYFWEDSEWVEDFRVLVNSPLADLNYFETDYIFSILGELYEDGAWIPEFLFEFYYDETGRLLGGADYEANGEDWLDEASEVEEYVYEGDLLHSILFYSMENGEVYDELTLFARSVLSYNGDVVNIESETGLPSGFTLRQNYPNPFNPTTLISYNLPEAADVRLEVFNIQGQRVGALVNAAQNAGTHNVTFNAANLASGVYLYRLQVGNAVITKKMILVK